MKNIPIKQALMLCLVALFAFSANAQYTETFESQTPFQSAFSSLGQSFTLTNNFTIFSSRAGFGYQHSNRFIDNSNAVGTNQTNAIKTTNAAKFVVKNLELYVSADGGNNPSSDGSLIITGKLGGVTQFTINKTSGFSTSFVPDNGFGAIDFTTEGGVDNSNTTIDEIDFQLQGNFNYIGIDNFTWAPQFLLPVSLFSYTAIAQSDGSVKLNWKTSYENNTSHFIINKSIDGKNFEQAGTVAAGNNPVATTYQFIDANPSQGANYYRLDEVDKDGLVKQLGIQEIFLYNRFNATTLYPNPVTNGSFTLTTQLPATAQNMYRITDISGKVVQRGTITSSHQTINVSSLLRGNYIIQLSNGEVIKWIKN